MQISDFISLFLAFCGGISVLGAASVYVAKAIGWIRKPEMKQDEILADHEARIQSLEAKTDKDYSAIVKLQQEVKMMLKATLAIMQHSIDGNDIKGLQKAKQDIEEYLIDK